MELFCTPLRGLSLPQYQSEGASGLDLQAWPEDDQDIIIQPMERKLIATGLCMAIPRNFEGQVRPRSGLAWKHGLSVVNTPGTIDSDYRGEIKVLLINLGQQPVKIIKGERIAQLVICPIFQVTLVTTEKLDDTKRGAGGYGHTGT